VATGATVVCGLALASCSSSSKVTFTARTTTFDDGTLRITTAPPQKTAVTQAAAEFDLAHSDLGGAGSAPKGLELGYVTVKASVMQANNPGQAVPTAPADQLSWVLFYVAGKSNCGNIAPSAPVPSFSVAHPSGKLALIVDAATGTGLGYEGAGSGSCAPQLSSPRVTQAGGNVSVPWKDSGSTYVTATYPPCVQPGGGTPGESDASGTTFTVIGFRYFAPCHAKAITAKVPVNFPRPWKPGALGPVPTGTSG
jgi:hypothetical protein